MPEARPRPNAGTKGVPRADREEQILEAAAEVFGTAGYAGTSVADVAARAGISKPLVYNYFGSKEGLFEACLRRNGELLLGEMERIARGDAVGIERGLLTLAGLFQILEPRPWAWRLVVDPTIPKDGPIDELVRGYLARITALNEEGVGEMLRLAGDTDPGDVSALAAVWHSIVDALVGWWLDHPGESAEAMTRRCVRLFRASLGSTLAASALAALDGLDA